MKLLKKYIFRIVILIIIISTILNSCGRCYALTPGDVISESIGAILGGIVGILTMSYRLIAIICAWALQAFTSLVALVDGSQDKTFIVTPYDIFFNNINILNINFFDVNNGGDVIKIIRSSVATWYYALRFISLAVLLVILIYVGIRMAISTIASEQAKYKKMLVDWLSSIALVFLLHYVILAIIYLNNGIVDAIKGATVANTYMDSIGHLMLQSIELNMYAIASTVITCLLAWQTFGFFVVYFNRMLKIGFLILISPLITITYSIDKMGDGKAQALNNWFKEFAFTVLIQPFHCVMYLCLVQTGLELIANSQGKLGDRLVSSLVAVILVNFLKKGEGIIRKIFGFKDDNNKTSLAKAVIQTKLALNAVKGVGNKTRRAINGGKKAAHKIKNFSRDARIQGAAAFHYLMSNNDKTYGDYKEDEERDYYNKKADKKEGKLTDEEKKRFIGHLEEAKDKASVSEKSEIEAIKKDIIANNSGAIRDDVAEARARYEYVNGKYKRSKKIKAAKKLGAGKKFIASKLPKKKANPNKKAAKITEPDVDITDKSTPDSTPKRFIRESKKMIAGIAKPVKDMVKDNIKESIPGGVGLFVASGAIATSDDLGNGLIEGAIAGNAISNEMYEFMNGTDASLTKDFADEVKNRQFNSLSEVNGLINEIDNNDEKYDPSSEKGKKKIDELVNNVISKINSDVNNMNYGKGEEVGEQIREAFKTNPTDASDRIEDIMREVTVNGVSFSETSEGKSLQTYASNMRLSQELNAFKESGGNVSDFREQMIRKSKKKFEKKSNDDVIDEILTSDEEGYHPEKYMSAIDDMSEEELKNLRNKAEREIEVREDVIEKLDKERADNDNLLKYGLDEHNAADRSKISEVKARNDAISKIRDEFDKQRSMLDTKVREIIVERLKELTGEEDNN